jgi:site-specific recombinase XerD
MPDDYAELEKQCERIRQENAKLLDEFADSLAAKGLSEKTIRRHRENMDFYLNHFLLYEDAEKAEAGVHLAGMFLGYWFIRKAMWSSRASIKSNAASLKKFYTFMVAEGKVKKEDLDDLKTEIKEGMPEWLATIDRYDDPDIDDPAEIWGF